VCISTVWVLLLLAGAPACWCCCHLLHLIAAAAAAAILLPLRLLSLEAIASSALLRVMLAKFPCCTFVLNTNLSRWLAAWICCRHRV